MFACPGLIFYTVCSVPWLNVNLALAEKCSGPLRFRLRQVLLYKLDCSPCPKRHFTKTPRYFTGIATCLQPFICIWQHWTSHTTNCRFHTSSAVHGSLSLFWDVTQPTLAVIYRRFGTTYRSCLQGQAVQEGNSTLEDGNDRLSRKVCNIPGLRDGKNFCTASFSLSFGVSLQIQYCFVGLRVNIR